ncbi:ankyrin repeat domain-containing protein, partial [bacterium]|nr:ankyrin repeat domain-containing protein [bacterium]
NQKWLYVFSDTAFVLERMATTLVDAPVAEEPAQDTTTKEQQLLNAVHQDEVDVVQELVAAKADPCQPVKFVTPIAAAVNRGNVDIVRLLLSAEEDPFSLTPVSVVPELCCPLRPYASFCCVRQATADNNIDLVRLLVKAHFKMSVDLSKFPGTTLVCVAVAAGATDVLDFLAEFLRNEEFWSADKTKCHPLHTLFKCPASRRDKCMEIVFHRLAELPTSHRQRLLHSETTNHVTPLERNFSSTSVVLQLVRCNANLFQRTSRCSVFDAAHRFVTKQQAAQIVPCPRLREFLLKNNPCTGCCMAGVLCCSVNMAVRRGTSHYDCLQELLRHRLNADVSDVVAALKQQSWNAVLLLLSSDNLQLSEPDYYKLLELFRACVPTAQHNQKNHYHCIKRLQQRGHAVLEQAASSLGSRAAGGDGGAGGGGNGGDDGGGVADPLEVVAQQAAGHDAVGRCLGAIRRDDDRVFDQCVDMVPFDRLEHLLVAAVRRPQVHAVKFVTKLLELGASVQQKPPQKPPQKPSQKPPQKPSQKPKKLHVGAKNKVSRGGKAGAKGKAGTKSKVRKLPRGCRAAIPSRAVVERRIYGSAPSSWTMSSRGSQARKRKATGVQTAQLTTRTSVVCSAASARNWQVVVLLLRAKAQVDKQERAPLLKQLVCSGPYGFGSKVPEAMRLLVSCKVSVHPSAHFHPLNTAFRMRSAMLIKLLLQHKADVLAKDCNNDCLLDLMDRQFIFPEAIRRVVAAHYEHYDGSAAK